jgi:hypothetical protein
VSAIESEFYHEEHPHRGHAGGAAMRLDAFGYNPFPGRRIPNDAAMGEEKLS